VFIDEESAAAELKEESQAKNTEKEELGLF
jgi:hypothetical protein